MTYVVFVAVMILLVLNVYIAVRIRWPHRHRSAGESRQPPSSEPTAAQVSPAAPPEHKRAESALVARRLAGEISHERYQQWMAGLARIDALRNPIVVPPDHDY